MALRLHSVLLIALASASFFGPVTAATAQDSHSDHTMPMAYRVKDAAWLDQIKPGQKIRFAADEIKGVMTVVRFEPVK